MNKYMLKSYFSIAKMGYDNIVKPIGQMTFEVGKSACITAAESFNESFTKEAKQEIKESWNELKDNCGKLIKK